MALFITLEGPDGSGKSTQATKLEEALHSLGYAVTTAREPGGTPLGDRLRELILDPTSPEATPLAMALMYSSARAQLVERVITPALQRDDVIVVDRYADSTIAYQAFGLGLKLDVARDLARIATGSLKPDVTFFIDVPPELGLRRLTERGRRDRLDAQTLGFHRRVYAGYQRLMDDEPGRWVRVDGTMPPGLVHDAILGAVLSRVKALKEPA